jgi:hypothetical protein
LSVGVGSFGVRVEIDDCRRLCLVSKIAEPHAPEEKPTLVVRERFVFSLKEKLPYVDIWDADRGTFRLYRHFCGSSSKTMQKTEGRELFGYSLVYPVTPSAAVERSAVGAGNWNVNKDRRSGTYSTAPRKPAATQAYI